MTNFDKIKQMSVDELAKVISRGISGDICDYCKYAEKCDAPSYCEYNSMTTVVEVIKDWLVDEYMNKQRYIDYDLIKQYPNKYNITPNGIKRLKVLDWDKLKGETWFNEVVTPNRWCKLIGCQKDGEKYDDWDEFWIGIAENGDIDCYFTCYEGMCSYNFKEFYDLKDIENEYDMQIQVNVIKWLNEMVDEGVLEL